MRKSAAGGSLLLLAAAALGLLGCGGDETFGGSEATRAATVAEWVADAGPDQNVQPGETVTLDGHGRSGSSNQQMFFKWSFAHRPAGSEAEFADPTLSQATFLADVPGTYIVQLAVGNAVADSEPDLIVIICEDR